MMCTHKFINWVCRCVVNTIPLLQYASNPILLIGILLICGCATARVNHTVGLRILDLETNVEKMIPSDGYREVLIDHPYTQSGFLTLTRKGSKLLLRHRDEEGRVIEETELPLLTSGYAGRNWMDISSDKSAIVYFDGKSHNLIIRSLRTGEERQLLLDIASSSIAIEVLKWLNDSEILLLINDINKHDRYLMMKINIENDQQSILRQPFYSNSNDISLSFDRRSLAVVEELPMWSYQLIILDVSKMKTLKVVPKVFSQMSVVSVCWLKNGRDLAFSDTSNSLYIYHLKTDTIEYLQGLSRGGGFIVGEVNNLLVIRESEGDPGSRS